MNFNILGKLNKKVIVIGIILVLFIIISIFLVKDGIFYYIGDMNVARVNHNMALLPDGKVLIFGGRTNRKKPDPNVMGAGIFFKPTKIAEIYDPKINKFKKISNTNFPHLQFSRAILTDTGKVLIFDYNYLSKYDFHKKEFLTTEYHLNESFDPVTGNFSAISSMNKPRAYFTATLLPGDNIMIANGYLWKNGQFIPDIEIYDIKADKFKTVAQLNIPRKGASAILLNNGKILILGGYSKNEEERYYHVLKAELFDYKTNRVQFSSDMKYNRMNFACTLLKDGKVLISGGWDEERNKKLASTEIYDPLTNKFYEGPLMKKKRSHHQSIMLNNGKIAIIGGCKNCPIEIYDPKKNTFKVVHFSKYPNLVPKSIHLNNNKILITGGKKHYKEKISKTARIYSY